MNAQQIALQETLQLFHDFGKPFILRLSSSRLTDGATRQPIDSRNARGNRIASFFFVVVIPVDDSTLAARLGKQQFTGVPTKSKPSVSQSGIPLAKQEPPRKVTRPRR
jgi:hypothetical protein